MGRLLAIDYGTKRTGIAATDPLQISPAPLTTVNTPQLINWLEQQLPALQPDKIIIGYPYKTKAQDNSIAPLVDDFMQQLTRLFPHIPIIPFDERYTSTLAHQTVQLSHTKKEKRKNKSLYDSLAACILLEDYIRLQENTRPNNE